MPTYIMLSTVTDEGSKTIKKNPGRIKEVNEEIEALALNGAFWPPPLLHPFDKPILKGAERLRASRGRRSGRLASQ